MGSPAARHAPNRPRITLLPNSGRASRGSIIVATSLANVLNEATQKLALHSAARKLYTIGGSEIKNYSELRSGMEVVVSCGEPFKAPPKSVKRAEQRQAPQDNIDVPNGAFGVPYKRLVWDAKEHPGVINYEGWR